MYRVRVNGKNFLIETDGELKKCGFFTTRFVDAADQSLAESKVVSLLRRDTFLKNNVRNEEDDAPMIFIDEIEFFENFDGTTTGTGFAWYDE